MMVYVGMAPKRKHTEEEEELPPSESNEAAKEEETMHLLSDWERLEKSRGRRAPEYDNEDHNLQAFEQPKGDPDSTDVWENPRLLKERCLAPLLNPVGLFCATTLIAEYAIMILVDVEYLANSGTNAFGSHATITTGHQGELNVSNAIRLYAMSSMNAYISALKANKDRCCVRLRSLFRIPKEWNPPIAVVGMSHLLSEAPGPINIGNAKEEFEGLQKVIDVIRPALELFARDRRREVFFDHDGNRIHDLSTRALTITGVLQWVHRDTKTNSITRVV